MFIKNSNYRSLFNLRILKNILASFVDSFLILYFLDISKSNILPIGIYKLISVITIFAVMFFVRNICKSKNRIYLMRIGIILDFIYFSSIILLRENVINYIYVIGLLYGLEEGFYYSVYNMLESDGITNKDRPKFLGTYTSVRATLSILFPLIFGSLIYTTGFTKTIIIVLIIIIIRLIYSFVLKDKNIPKMDKTNMKEYFSLTKGNNKIKSMYKIMLFSGLTYSEGAFSTIIMIYIIKVFSNSFSLGIFTSIFSLITFIIGILFTKWLKEKNYEKYIIISMTFTIVSLISMIIYCNAITIIIFNLFQTISRGIMDLINESSQLNLSNYDSIKDEYKVEYWLTLEGFLVIGRIISNILLIVLAYTNSNLIIVIFIIFLILLASNSVRLQKLFNKE